MENNDQTYMLDRMNGKHAPFLFEVFQEEWRQLYLQKGVTPYESTFIGMQCHHSPYWCKGRAARYFCPHSVGIVSVKVQHWSTRAGFTIRGSLKTRGNYGF